MPYHSKWQDLPTEAINPDTLGIDTMPVLDIIDLISAEDRRSSPPCTRNASASRTASRSSSSALKKGGRLFLVGAGTSGRLGVARSGRDAADVRHVAEARAGHHGRRPGSGVSRARRRRGQLRGRRAQHRAAARVEARRRHRRVGQRHHPVRARRAHRRAARRARASSSSPAGPAPSSRTSST